MRMKLSLSFLLLWTATITGFCQAPPGSPPTAPKADVIKPLIRETTTIDWEPSVVTIDVRKKTYDYFQPWTTPSQSFQKFGTILAKNQILTTAENLSDKTLLRIQKEGRGKWNIGEIAWVDYHANLALITVADEKFWTGLKPVTLAPHAKTTDPLRLVRWRTGKLEVRSAEFNQFTVEEGKISFAQYVHMEASSEINGAGWGEPLVAGGQVLGITSYQNGNSCKVIPSSFINDVLQAAKSANYRGLGYFDFVWQNSENNTLLEYLKLKGDQRGVVIIEPPTHGDTNSIKSHDVILSIDGFAIDTSGDYVDPEYGHLMLENLATRKHWAGDKVKLGLWRDGKEVSVDYEIPKVDYMTHLVPDEIFDQPPQYYMVGGLVFQPLTDMYLRSWGADWKRRAPFRLNYYNNEPQTKERPFLVLLSQVLPDSANLGYQDYRFMVVDKVNGKKISVLQDIEEALKNPQNGFQVFEFMKGDNLQKLVMDAGEAKLATERILARYGIEKDKVFGTPTPEKAASALTAK
ncbi:MAG: hypothetical protein JWM04_568 [Verrucomicrobiales bacterium]|nr:hypothetical protein [Verrucomicrobiales bacterium]